MSTKDPRVDSYIQKAAPFAQPILKHIRRIVHAACPDVQETMKWNTPTFDYKGIMCGMAAFKAHAILGFWKAKLLADRGLPGAGHGEMGQRGRITSIDELPSEATLTKLVKAAAELNEQGVTVKRPKTALKPPVKPPAYFLTAIKKNKRALANYEAFSPSHKREYVEWVTDAKSDETRARRLTQAVTWMAQGKSRNWKYERA
jgi:hypothetical protein